MPKVLFTLVRSPFEKDEIHTMETVAANNEKGVILFEDAIYYATSEHKRRELLSKDYLIYAIKEELDARGHGEFSAEGIELIDYDEAVDIIMERYDKVISL
ncbi:MAG: sulfurtransferase complex subunit TusB [Thermoplasmata archaeon]|nr:MAG: sulfurtransferase complex subunit TusB [Thermoplasmata archaeon]